MTLYICDPPKMEDNFTHSAVRLKKSKKKIGRRLEIELSPKSGGCLDFKM